MKIAVIGATGLVGNAAVSELAARGHQVAAIARNTAKVARHPNVTAVAAGLTACSQEPAKPAASAPAAT